MRLKPEYLMTNHDELMQAMSWRLPNYNEIFDAISEAGRRATTLALDRLADDGGYMPDPQPKLAPIETGVVRYTAEEWRDMQGD